MKPNMLFVTCHLPFPPNSGGRRREFEIIKLISRNYKIHLCVVSKTYMEDVSNSSYLHKYCEEIKIFKANYVDENYFYEIPAQIYRNQSIDAANYILHTLNDINIDIIHVEGFYLLHLIPDHNAVPIVLTEQNIEYSLWYQRYIHAVDEERKNYFKHQYEMTKQAELLAWQRSDSCIVLTEEDESAIKGYLPNKKIYIISDGVDHNLDIHSRTTNAGVLSKPRAPCILYVGNYGYYPNVDAVHYLCHTILPYIKNMIPEVTVLLAGNDPHFALEPLKNIPGVVVTGEVPSLSPYYEYTDVFVCPLRIGGGVKVKMLEALYKGKAIVSTSVGVQGLPAGPELDYITYDDPEQFASRVVHILNSEAEKEKCESIAQHISSMLPTWEQVCHNLINIYNHHMN